MEKLLLDVVCETMAVESVKTLLVCSGQIITCSFSLYSALVIFERGSVSPDECINRLFNADMGASARESVLEGLRRGSFFKTNSIHDHLGVQRNVYVKYSFADCVENSFTVGTISDKVSALTVVCTDSKYIKAVVNRLGGICVSYIYPYLSPKETFVYEFDLRFPGVFLINAGEKGDVFPPSRDLFRGSDKVGELLGCSIELCPLYNSGTRSKEIGAANLRFFSCTSVGRLLDFSDPLVVDCDLILSESRAEMIENLLGESSVSVSILRKVEGVSFYSGGKFADTESQLIEQLCAILRHFDPDILVGYKLVSRTINLLKDRCDFLCTQDNLLSTLRPEFSHDGSVGSFSITRGRIIYDMRTVFEETSKCMPFQFYNDLLFTTDSRKVIRPLNLSVDALVGCKGYDFWKNIPGNLCYFCSEHAAGNMLSKMERYTSTLLNFLKLSKILPLHFKMSSMLGCPLDSVVNKKSLATAEWWIGGLLYKSGGILIPPKKHKKTSTCPLYYKATNLIGRDDVLGRLSNMSGAYSQNCVCDERPCQGTYSGGIKEVNLEYLGMVRSTFVEIDGKSMYPSMVREYSIDISDSTPILVPLMTKLLCEREEHSRKSTKPTDHHAIASLVLKLAANSVYGAFGSGHFRFSMVSRIASRICESSRQFITAAKETLETINLPWCDGRFARVAYVDTDGIILDIGNTEGISMDDIKEWVSQITRDLVSSYRCLEFKIEAFYRAIYIKGKANLIMYKIVQDQEPPGFEIHLRAIVKGLFNNRTTCSAVRIALVNVLEFVFENLDRFISCSKDTTEIHNELSELVMSCREEFFQRTNDYFAKWVTVGKKSENLLPLSGSKRAIGPLLIGKKHKNIANYSSASEGLRKSSNVGKSAGNPTNNTGLLLETIASIHYLEIPDSVDIIGSVRCSDGVTRFLDVVEIFSDTYRVDKDYYWDTVFRKSLMGLLCGNLIGINGLLVQLPAFGRGRPN